MSTLEFAGAATRLAAADIDNAADELRCDPAVIQAVCDVESAGHGFLPDGRPTILFEAHSFYTLTRGKFGQSNISSPIWNRSLYGAAGAHQYDRLSQAIALERGAALESASWGLFQIMGSNFAACGFDNVEAFVAAMAESEARHLAAFVSFCQTNRLDAYLRANPPDFTAFARGYNGPAYAENSYDTKLAAAYRKWLAAPAPARPAPAAPAPPQAATTVTPDDVVMQVERLQESLKALGLYTGPIDGMCWNGTRDAAMRAYHAAKG